MTKLHRRLIIAILLVLAASLLTGASWQPGPSVVSLDILSVNDFHGALAATDSNPGAAVLAAYLRSERAKNPEGTLMLSAGDMFQGTPDSNLLHGKTVVEVMNTIGFDAMALGNHEFDWGIAVLKERQGQAAFPMLAANVIGKADGRPLDFIRPYVIITKQGVKIAVVGLITPDTAVTTNPRYVDGLTFLDPAAALKRLIPELKRQGVDIIVALCHMASYPGEEPSGEATALAALEGVDAVVSGHSHNKVAGKVGGVPVVQAYYNGRAVSAVHIAYARKSREVLTTVETKKVPLTISPDSPIAAIVARASDEIAPLKREVLGRTVNGLAHDRYQLSPLGQWVADVMRQATGADIAFENGGGLRASLQAGTVTMGDLYTVMPFDNTLQVVAMTGEQVRAALEHGLGNEKFGRLQFAGLRVAYDAAQPEGRRVVSVQLADGTSLDPAATYQVAVNDFLAAGGDDYTMIKAAGTVVDTYRPLRDVLAEAIRKAGVIRFGGDDRLRRSMEGASAERAMDGAGVRRPVSGLPSGLMAA